MYMYVHNKPSMSIMCVIICNIYTYIIFYNIIYRGIVVHNGQ